MANSETNKRKHTGISRTIEATTDVKTAPIILTADMVEMYNHKINKEFDNVDHCVHSLFNNWISPAKEEANSKYNTIKRTYYDLPGNRFDIIEEYVKALREVANIYENVETKNTNMKDAYKIGE